MTKKCNGCGWPIPEGVEGLDFPIHACHERDLNRYLRAVWIGFGIVLFIGFTLALGIKYL